jgi:hypothetical protein
MLVHTAIFDDQLSIRQRIFILLRSFRPECSDTSNCTLVVAVLKHAHFLTLVSKPTQSESFDAYDSVESSKLCHEAVFHFWQLIHDTIGVCQLDAYNVDSAAVLSKHDELDADIAQDIRQKCAAEINIFNRWLQSHNTTSQLTWSQTDGHCAEAHVNRRRIKAQLGMECFFQTAEVIRQIIAGVPVRFDQRKNVQTAGLRIAETLMYLEEGGFNYRQVDLGNRGQSPNTLSPRAWSLATSAAGAFIEGELDRPRPGRLISSHEDGVETPRPQTEADVATAISSHEDGVKTPRPSEADLAPAISSHKDGVVTPRPKTEADVAKARHAAESKHLTSMFPQDHALRTPTKCDIVDRSDNTPETARATLEQPWRYLQFSDDADIR